MQRQYTPYQQQAIDSVGLDICVSAGAGSGKTGVLVERFVRLVAREDEHRVGVGGILVITFTKKAAREVKGRIVTELMRRDMLDARREVESAYISTIHGFCSRLLQENPFEAGIDPQFKVIDPAEAKRRFRQAVEASVAAAFSAGDDETFGLLMVVSREMGGPDAGDPIAQLGTVLDAIVQSLSTGGHTVEDLAEFMALPAEERDALARAPLRSILETVVADAAAGVTALEAIADQLTGGARARVNSVLSAAADLRAAAGDPGRCIGAIHEMARNAKSARSGMEAGPLNQIAAACAGASALPADLDARQEAAQTLRTGLWRAALRAWELYSAEKRQRGEIDNNDLQTAAVTLLERNVHIRERYRRQFRHIFVDEFQDTNAAQMRLIEILHTREWPAEIGSASAAPWRAGYRRENGGPVSPDVPRNYLFIVGDIQQSIYSFRYARPEFFARIEHAFAAGPESRQIALNVNFRSRPDVLQVIGHMFGKFWADASSRYAPLQAGATYDAAASPRVDLLLGRPAWKPGSRREYARGLAIYLRSLIESQRILFTDQQSSRRGMPIQWGDIALLVRTARDLEVYESAFAEAGIPFYAQAGGRGYYARQEIRDLVSALTMIESPLDDLALAAALRSPFVGASADGLLLLRLEANRLELPGLYPAVPSLLEGEALPEPERRRIGRFYALIEELRAVQDSLPVGQMLERLIAGSHLDARAACRTGGLRRLANIRKMVQMAHADPSVCIREFIGRLRELEKLSEREGDAPLQEEAANVVRLLTMHGAKGLEFPVVVLPDLSERHRSGRGRTEKFVCDPSAFALGVTLDEQPCEVLAAIDIARERYSREEEMRVLYVAMTRAREHLVLCGANGSSECFMAAVQLAVGILEAPDAPADRAVGDALVRVIPLPEASGIDVTAGEREASPGLDSLAFLRES